MLTAVEVLSLKYKNKQTCGCSMGNVAYLLQYSGSPQPQATHATHYKLG